MGGADNGVDLAGSTQHFFAATASDMSATQILVLLAMTVYAVFHQSIRHELEGRPRFKLPIVYVGVGLLAGVVFVPPDARSWLVLGVGVLAGVVVGWARGLNVHVWRGADGRLYSQGTAFTTGLLVALVAGKWTWGAWEYLQHAHPHGGFGEVLPMIAAMVSMHDEIVWWRALRLAPAAGASRSGATFPHSLV